MHAAAVISLEFFLIYWSPVTPRHPCTREPFLSFFLIYALRVGLRLLMRTQQGLTARLLSCPRVPPAGILAWHLYWVRTALIMAPRPPFQHQRNLPPQAPSWRYPLGPHFLLSIFILGSLSTGTHWWSRLSFYPPFPWVNPLNPHRHLFWGSGSGASQSKR